jgi:outer membrane protein OmpA-like peptidoglycan-associated protein
VVYFDLDRFREVSHTSPVDVRDVAATIENRGNIAGLRVDGHADDRGRPRHNLRLSRRRACRVAAKLRRLLVPAPPPIEVRAFGEARPVAPNMHPNGSDDPRGRARNRRVEVTVLSHVPTKRSTCAPAR